MEEEEEVEVQPVQPRRKEEPTTPKRKEESLRPLRRRPIPDATTEKEYVVLRRTRPQKEEEDVSTTSK